VHTDQGKKEEGEACVASGVGFALAELTSKPHAIEGGPATAIRAIPPAVAGTRDPQVTKIEDGKPVPEMVATKIDRKPVSDDALSRPQATTR